MVQFQVFKNAAFSSERTRFTQENTNWDVYSLGQRWRKVVLFWKASITVRAVATEITSSEEFTFTIIYLNSWIHK